MIQELILTNSIAFDPQFPVKLQIFRSFFIFFRFFSVLSILVGLNCHRLPETVCSPVPFPPETFRQGNGLLQRVTVLFPHHERIFSVLPLLYFLFHLKTSYSICTPCSFPPHVCIPVSNDSSSSPPRLPLAPVPSQPLSLSRVVFD